MSEEKTCCVEAAEGEDWDAPIALVRWCGVVWGRVGLSRGFGTLERLIDSPEAEAITVAVWWDVVVVIQYS